MHGGIQFGVWYRPPTPKDGKVSDRISSAEYQRDHSQSNVTYMEVQCDYKRIRIEVLGSISLLVYRADITSSWENLT